MTTRSEDVLFASLTDIDALERLAQSGFDPICVPTEEFRPMVTWAIDVYFDSGRRQAPSREMLLHIWGELLEEEEVDLIDEDVEIDTIETAIDDLRAQYVHVEWQDWIKSAATVMSTTNSVEKVETLMAVTNDLFHLTNRVQDRSNETTARDGFNSSLADYKERAEQGHTSRGMTFGLDLVDQHTFGIHPGEMAILAAGPKVGKSFFLLRVALHEWAVKGRTVVLDTLENPTDMTMDRAVCVHLGIDPRQYQRGLCEPEQVARIEEYIHDVVPTLPGELHLLSPSRGMRTPERLVREAKLRGAQSLLVDQMTHVEHPSPGRKARHELFNENVHEFADLIKDGRDPISMLLANQINRAGIEAGRKLNYHEMEHLAESAGIERAANWVFALHQSADERMQRVAKLQIMAARREDVENWQILWGPEKGLYKARHTIELDRGAA